jgi:hypothetical protein
MKNEMKSSMKALEEKLERWIEGSIIRLFGHQIPASTIASELTEAMENGLRTNEHGKTVAPDNYRITLNPETLDEFKKSLPELKVHLSNGLVDAAKEQSILFMRSPEVLIHPEASTIKWDINVVAWHSTSPLDETHEMDAPAVKGDPTYPTGAFFIINGNEHFLLDRPVINIGRRPDNHLVLKSALVSRTHAQLRSRHGRFMLFDLGSKSGTMVHGIPIKNHILRPGDVITIADIQLVYGEETISSADETIGFTPLPPHKVDE